MKINTFPNYLCCVLSLLLSPLAQAAQTVRIDQLAVLDLGVVIAPPSGQADWVTLPPEGGLLISNNQNRPVASTRLPQAARFMISGDAYAECRIHVWSLSKEDVVYLYPERIQLDGSGRGYVSVGARFKVSTAALGQLSTHYEIEADCQVMKP